MYVEVTRTKRIYFRLFEKLTYRKMHENFIRPLHHNKATRNLLPSHFFAHFFAQNVALVQIMLKAMKYYYSPKQFFNIITTVLITLQVHFQVGSAPAFSYFFQKVLIRIGDTNHICSYVGLQTNLLFTLF